MIKKILVALDASSCANAVLNYSIELALSHNARLTGVVVENTKALENVGPASVGAGFYAKQLREYQVAKTQKKISEIIAGFESACKSANLTYGIKWEKGEPLNVMASCAQYHDLTITGLRDLFDYGVISEPKKLLRRLVCSGVHPLIALSPHAVKTQRVLIVCDGSRESATAIQAFVRLHPWPHSVSRILCCEHSGNNSQQLLKDSSEYCQAHGLSVENAMLMCRSKERLLEHAMRWSADLIVTSQCPRNDGVRHIFNHPMDRLIKDSQIPILIAS